MAEGRKWKRLKPLSDSFKPVAHATRTAVSTAGRPRESADGVHAAVPLPTDQRDVRLLPCIEPGSEMRRHQESARLTTGAAGSSLQRIPSNLNMDGCGSFSRALSSDSGTASSATSCTPQLVLMSVSGLVSVRPHVAVTQDLHSSTSAPDIPEVLEHDQIHLGPDPTLENFSVRGCTGAPDTPESWGHDQVNLEPALENFSVRWSTGAPDTPEDQVHLEPALGNFSVRGSTGAPDTLEAWEHDQFHLGKKKRKRPDPALENFSERPRTERIRCFWEFMIEAVKGPNSEEPFCREYVLGGILPFIADVKTVAQEVLIPYHDNLAEQLWRVAVVVWLGAGGPGLQTFRHITQGTELCGEAAAEDLRLPSIFSENDVDRVYEHLRRLKEAHGRSAVLSGDGQSVKFRFSNAQGVAVLRSWRQCIQHLVSKVGGSPWQLARLGPEALNELLTSAISLGTLAAKELFAYLYLAHPVAFDVDKFIPVGSGAERGGRAVLGHAPDAKVDWSREFSRMVEEIPVDLGKKLKMAIQERAASCPFRNDARLPGAVSQLREGRATAADVEVCMCFFMNFLRAKYSGVAPAGWQMLLRRLW